MESATAPLVTCMMPTYNRRAFIPDAIRYFLRQDYANKELLIVDDGTDCIQDLIPVHPQIRYIRRPNNMTLGEKRNFCVRESRGDLIMHWDDDDWMAPYRITYQVGELCKQRAEVCGLQKMLYCEINTGECWLYKYPANAQPWLAGNSLLYTKEFWRKKPFPDIQVASDTQFIFSRTLRSYVALSDYNFYVASVHQNNTSRKYTGSSLWQPVLQDTVRNITGAEWPLRKITGTVHNDPVKTTAQVISIEAATKNKVSACLLSFKRPGNMQRIVDIIQGHGFIDEIIIWNNNTERPLEVRGEKVRIINASENTICYGRFLCAREAKNDIIYFQDDDAVVGNIRDLYNAFLKNDSMISYALSPQHFKIRDKYDYYGGQVAFLGWGSLIRKDWIHVLDRYLERIPDARDYIFRREADKFFTILLGKKNNTMPASIELLEYDSMNGISLYLEKDHLFCVAQAIRKALEYNRRLSENIFPVTWNIVITCMNYGRFLQDAVNSVLFNHADYTITIVDDGSTDNTAEVCAELTGKYPFIRCIRNEISRGTGFARNQGISAVDSIFVVLLDADDRMGAEYLFESEKLLRKGFDVANPDAILFGDISTRWPVPETVTLSMQLDRNFVHCCAAFRRSYWAQVGGLDEQMKNWEDYEFWIRLASAGARIRKLTGDHFYYRKHGSSRSGEVKNNELNLKKYIEDKHRHLYLLKK
jgi:glycosyltransferase involved in cell wall biosynthesis